MRAAVQTLDNQIVSRRSRVAWFFTRIAHYLPRGSAAARTSAFTGFGESLLISQGSIPAAAKGGLLGWLTAWAGEALDAWTKAARPGSFPATWLAPAVKTMNDLIGEVVSPELQGSPSLAGAMGCVYGVAVGCFGQTGGTGRLGKIVGSGIEHGFRRLIGTWAAERVVETANEARRERRNTVPSATSSWTKDQPVDVRLSGPKLPSGKHVEEEDSYVRSLLPESRIKQLEYCEEHVTESLEKLCEMAGLPYDRSWAHHAYLTTRHSAYNPIFNVLVRPSLDLGGVSMVRVTHEHFKKGLRNTELQLALLRARIRAELSGVRIFSDGDLLKVTSGYRTKILEPRDRARKERLESESRKVASAFDGAVNNFLAHLAEGLTIKADGDGTNAPSVRMQSLYYKIPEERRPEFLHALLLGKREMTLEPLCAFFSREGVPPIGSPERDALESKILTLSDALGVG